MCLLNTGEFLNFKNLQNSKISYKNCWVDMPAADADELQIVEVYEKSANDNPPRTLTGGGGRATAQRSAWAAFMTDYHSGAVS